MVLSQIFTNLVQNRYEIKPEYTKHAKYLAEWMPMLNQDYELGEILTTQGENSDSAHYSPSMRAWKENLRMTDWQKMFICPKATLKDINHLLSLIK